MAQIVTAKNGQTNGIEYPRTVKSALLNDDGTPLNPLTQTNIINDLTTGGETNVLSAQQGVALTSAIGQLQTERGYLYSKQITDCNLALMNGFYVLYNALNQPIVGGYTWTLEVVNESTVLKQIATCVFGTPSLVGRIFIRTANSNSTGWSAWKEIATTENYVMQASDMRNGWALGHGNTVQKIGNRVFFRFQIHSGVTNVDTVVCNIPVGFRPVADRVFIARAYTTTNENPVNQFMTVWPDGNVQIKYTSSKPFIFIEASWEV